MPNSEEMTEDGQQIKARVQFITKHEELRVAETPFAIPVSLGRAGMSEVINHFLELETPQSFDFLIQNRLVRTSLKKFIRTYQLNTEDVIVIEYMPAISLSDEGQTVDAPAWVGSLVLDHCNNVIAGCYDGQIQVLNEKKDIVSSVQLHQEPIRCMTMFSDSSAKYLATASKDQTIKYWKIDNQKAGKKSTYSVVQYSNLSGHVNSVESLTYNNDGIILSGDYNGNIFGWSTTINADNVEKTSVKKKSKGNKGGNNPSVVDSKPILTIRGHAQCISALLCPASNNNHLFSASWDHTLKIWDIERQDCVTTYGGGKVITSIDYSPHNNLIATSHPDGRIRMWDTRLNSDNTSVQSFTSSSSTKQWISQVKWKPHADSVFASTDYDGALRVWDIRSTAPLITNEVHDGKALCLLWHENVILSGGSDCTVQYTPLVI